jgi:2-phosphosulfolactate phosphatase
VAWPRILQLVDAPQLRPDETAVVVDVLRATSTIAVALAQGARAVLPVMTPDDARAAAKSMPGCVLVGERERGPLEGFVDNSPATLARMPLAGRDVVMTTTNGTGALLASRGAGRVVAGGLVNASALATALSGTKVALVAAGWRGARADDDDVCCEYLAARLDGDTPDPREVLDRLEGCTSAIKLRAHGRGADVDVCLSIDAALVVPVLKNDRLAPG